MKRWALEDNGCGDYEYGCKADLDPSDDGEWVLYDEAMHEITRLTLENEGLRKAMADCIEALDKARRTRVVLAKANDNG